MRLTVEQVQKVDEVVPLFRLPTTVELRAGGKSRSIPILIDGLDDDDFMVRFTFLNLLAMNAKLADAAIPKFTELLDNPSRSGVAAKALGEIGSPAKASIPKIIVVMGQRNDSTRLEFILALEKFGRIVVSSDLGVKFGPFYRL